MTYTNPIIFARTHFDDGKWIVFESERTGNMEIWKINLETMEQTQLTFSDPHYSCRTPRW
ncbi:MAG: hypothetical protein HOH77_23515 [Candidatus Latescibacteria bacterium]|nr:hypothetical protein [Candidatus Latescibacterota bacterium]